MFKAERPSPIIDATVDKPITTTAACHDCDWTSDAHALYKDAVRHTIYYRHKVKLMVEYSFQLELTDETLLGPGAYIRFAGKELKGVGR